MRIELPSPSSSRMFVFWRWNDENKAACAIGGDLRFVRACGHWPRGAGSEPCPQSYRASHGGAILQGGLAGTAGHYVLTTVIPGDYPGRTPHIHVKLRAPGGKTLTTQIFFPGNAGNDSDPKSDRSLVIAMSTDGKSGQIDFVIPAP